MSNGLLSVIILAGGRSSRMGQDKAWLALDGLPLALHVARRVVPLAGEIIFSTNQPAPFAALAAQLAVPTRTVADLHPGEGPLSGLEAGLSAAASDVALLLAVDMPFVSLPLLRYMLSQAGEYDAVIPLVRAAGTGELSHEPLHALYRRTCLPAISAHLAAGRRRVVSFLDDVRVRELLPAETAAYDPAGLSFFNVNTPADWLAAQEALKRVNGQAPPRAG